MSGIFTRDAVGLWAERFVFMAFSYFSDRLSCGPSLAETEGNASTEVFAHDNPQGTGEKTGRARRR